MVSRDQKGLDKMRLIELDKHLLLLSLVLSVLQDDARKSPPTFHEVGQTPTFAADIHDMRAIEKTFCLNRCFALRLVSSTS